MMGRRTRRRPKAGRRFTATQQHPISTCPACGKQAYTSKATAKQTARILYPGDTMRVYNCPGTPWWHMTSQNAARTTEIRDRLAARSGMAAARQAGEP